MAHYSWREFNQCFKNDLTSARLVYDKLISLLKNCCLDNEIYIAKSVGKRLAIRLRNSKITRIVNQLKQVFSDFNGKELVQVLEENCSNIKVENYDIKSGCILFPWKDQIDLVLVKLAKNAEILFRISVLAFYLFCESQPWIRLGHLATHFLMIASCVARINVLCKAILVYVYDFYCILYDFEPKLKERNVQNFQFNSDSLTTQSPEFIEVFLTKINIKCHKTDTKSNLEVHFNKNEDIGVPVKREAESEESLFKKNKRLATSKKKNTKKVVKHKH